MTIGERIRVLRKELSLTQSEFGENIGLKQAVIGQMENNTRNITDRTVILICEKYNVSEEWLRIGDGEMFKQDESAVVSQLSREYGLDDLDRRIIESYLQLDAAKRSVIKDYVRSIFKEQIGMETADEINEEVESYRRELEQEKSSQMSPALPHSSENVG